MKTIGLLGGMSWESTVTYYQTINRTIAQQLGGLHSARLVLHSVEFDEIQALQHAGKWHETGVILAAIYICGWCSACSSGRFPMMRTRN